MKHHLGLSVLLLVLLLVLLVLLVWCSRRQRISLTAITGDAEQIAAKEAATDAMRQAVEEGEQAASRAVLDAEESEFRSSLEGTGLKGEELEEKLSAKMQEFKDSDLYKEQLSDAVNQFRSNIADSYRQALRDIDSGKNLEGAVQGLKDSSQNFFDSDDFELKHPSEYMSLKEGAVQDPPGLGGKDFDDWDQNLAHNHACTGTCYVKSANGDIHEVNMFGDKPVFNSNEEAIQQWNDLFKDGKTPAAGEMTDKFESLTREDGKPKWEFNETEGTWSDEEGNILSKTGDGGFQIEDADGKVIKQGDFFGPGDGAQSGFVLDDAGNLTELAIPPKLKGAIRTPLSFFDQLASDAAGKNPSPESAVGSGADQARQDIHQEITEAEGHPLWDVIKWAGIGMGLYAFMNKIIMSKSPITTNPAEIWKYIPPPGTPSPMCWTNSYVYQEPIAQNTIQSVDSLDSNQCIQSCVKNASCNAVTYQQKPLDGSSTSKCSLLKALDVRQFQTQPPQPALPNMTSYRCNQFDKTTYQSILESTGCFNSEGVQQPDLSCLDCPATSAGAMCVDAQTKPVACPTSPASSVCNNLNDCPYLSETCPQKCTAPPNTGGNYWIDRLQAVENLVYVGCYQSSDQFPPHDSCVNSKCVPGCKVGDYVDPSIVDSSKCTQGTWVTPKPDGTSLDTTSVSDCGPDKGYFCSGCPHIQTCYDKQSVCYEAMCECPIEDIQEGKCSSPGGYGVVDNESACKKPNSASASDPTPVWRGPMDISTRCATVPICWDKGIPDLQTTDQATCETQGGAWQEPLSADTRAKTGCPPSGGGGGDGSRCRSRSRSIENC